MSSPLSELCDIGAKRCNGMSGMRKFACTVATGDACVAVLDSTHGLCVSELTKEEKKIQPELICNHIYNDAKWLIGHLHSPTMDRYVDQSRDDFMDGCKTEIEKKVDKLEPHETCNAIEDRIVAMFRQ